MFEGGFSALHKCYVGSVVVLILQTLLIASLSRMSRFVKSGVICGNRSGVVISVGGVSGIIVPERLFAVGVGVFSITGVALGMRGERLTLILLDGGGEGVNRRLKGQLMSGKGGDLRGRAPLGVVEGARSLDTRIDRSFIVFPKQREGGGLVVLC